MSLKESLWREYILDKDC